MKQIPILILLVLCLSASAQVSLFEKGRDGYLNISSDRVELIHEERPEILDLLIDGNVLELHRAEVFTDSYSIRTNEGDVFPRNEKMLFYRGKIEGYKNSLVSVSFIGDEVHVMFSSKKGDFRIHPIHGSDQYRFFQDTLTPVLSCFTTEEYMVTQEFEPILFAVGNCVEVYFECDFKSFQNNGSSVSNTEAWVASLFNELATLYENEGIPVMISDIMVWTTVDPYASLNSVGAMLNAFVASTTQNEPDGRLAHLLSTRSLGGGVAYVNVLCHNTLACAVSGSLSTNIVPFPNYSWNVTVVAHEMGHNFGASHTHNCVWNGNNTQIDDCGSQFGDVQPCYNSQNPIIPSSGTIMSYCHLIAGVGINFTLGFGDQPGALILNKYNNAPCNTGQCVPLAIGIEQFQLRTDQCVVYLRWVADFPMLSESDDGIEWESVPVSGDAYADYTPSKYYRLESEGSVRTLVNYDLCDPPYRVIGSDVFINTKGRYQISSTDGKVFADSNYKEGSRITLDRGAWVITFKGHSEIIVIIY